MGLRLGYLITGRPVGGSALSARSDTAKDAEFLVVPHQLAVWHRQVGRPPLTWADRVIRLDRLGGLIHEYAQVT